MIMRNKIKFYKRYALNLYGDVKAIPRFLKVKAVLQGKKRNTEARNVIKYLSLRIDLRTPKKQARKRTAFGKAFRMKQFVKKFYGDLSERRFKSALVKNAHKRGSSFRTDLLWEFESKVDVMIFRANFALSPQMARQWILHGFVFVNGIKAVDPNLFLRLGDVVSFHPYIFGNIFSNLRSRLLDKTFMLGYEGFCELNFGCPSILVFDKPKLDIYNPARISLTKALPRLQI
jgi:ribosomal protein S4